MTKQEKIDFIIKNTKEEQKRFKERMFKLDGAQVYSLAYIITLRQELIPLINEFIESNAEDEEIDLAYNLISQNRSLISVFLKIFEDSLNIEYLSISEAFADLEAYI